MKITLSFLLPAVLFFACESVPVKRTYTEKDIEGYWATDNFLNPSQLKDSLSAIKFQPSEEFLRFFNSCNGFVDTVYRISRDTVYVLEIEMDVDHRFVKVYVPKYVISFASDDRIVLTVIDNGTQKIFYSLMKCPDQGNHLTSAELLGCSGILWNQDSVISSTREEFCRGCGFGLEPQIAMKSDSKSFERLSHLYSRIDRRRLLFGERSFAHSPNSVPVAPPNGVVNLIGFDANDIVWLSDCSDPCVWAIHEELISVERVNYFAYPFTQENKVR